MERNTSQPLTVDALTAAGIPAAQAPWILQLAKLIADNADLQKRVAALEAQQ
jgi:hypothetical protein